MNRYRVYVVVMENNSPKMKRGTMLNEADDTHDNILLEGSGVLIKIKTDLVFDNMQDCLNKCKELDD